MILTITQFVVEQDRYQHGEVPANAEVVSLNVPVLAAEDGLVLDPDLAAFSDHLAQREKYTVRVCVSVVDWNANFSGPANLVPQW